MKMETLEAKTEACEMDGSKIFGPLMAIIATFVFLSSAQAADTSSGDPKETAIRELSARMTEAYNNGDVGGVAANFTPDGHLISGRRDTPAHSRRHRALFGRVADETAKGHALRYYSRHRRPLSNS